MMSCIQWFKSLIADRDFDRIKREFRELAQEKGGYFMPNPLNSEVDDETAYCVDEEKGGKMSSTFFSFSSFVDKRINEELNKSILSISKENAKLKENEKADFLTSLIIQLKPLIYLNEKTDVLDKRKEFNSALVKISEFISNETLITVELDETVLYPEEPVFGCKIRSKSEIRFLCNTLVELGLFKPCTTLYDHFYEIFITSTSTMFVKLQPITVSCSNNTAAYILRQIEPLFSRLNFSTIVESKMIYNRKNKPFSRGSLDTALSKFNAQAEYDDTLKTEIDEALLPLINKR